MVYYISFEQLQHIYQAFPSFNSNVRVLTEKYYQLADERNYMLRMGKSSDRYAHMVKYYEEL